MQQIFQHCMDNLKLGRLKSHNVNGLVPSPLAGPPCSSNCLFEVQGNVSLQNISTSAGTSFSELAALNDANDIPASPDQQYLPTTICVSAKLCQDQRRISQGSQDDIRTCDASCQLIPRSGYESTYAQAADELNAAAKHLNSQATTFNAQSAYVEAGPSFNILLLLNTASDYIFGGNQS